MHLPNILQQEEKSRLEETEIKKNKGGNERCQHQKRKKGAWKTKGDQGLLIVNIHAGSRKITSGRGAPLTSLGKGEGVIQGLMEVKNR